MEKLQLGLSIVRRRWLVVSITFIVGFLGVLFFLVSRPKTYEAESHVLIFSEASGRDPSVSMIDLPVVASSTVVLGRALDRLHLTIPLIKLKNSIKIKVGGARSSIMEISYRDDKAERAVAVPNAIADELARYYEQISTSRASVTVHKLDVALAAVQSRLARINRELAEQSAEEPFLGSDKALDALTNRMDDLELQRELAGATLTSDLASAAAVAGDGKELSSIARHEMLQADPLYGNLLQTTARDEAELRVDNVVHSPDHPENLYLTPKVRGERATLNAEAHRFLHSPDAYSPSLAQNADARRRAQALIVGDRARIDALDRIIATERARLDRLPRSSVTNAWLRLQRDSAQADYLTLTSHRTAAVASRAEALSLGSVVVVDRAVRADTTTVGMGRGQLAIASTLFVLVLSFGSAFLVEFFDPSLRRDDQIENIYGVPVIATLTGTRV